MDHAAPYIRPPVLLSHLVNPIVVRLGLTPTLLVHGRRTGRELAVPLGAPFVFDGRRYLVSGRGETHWVRNLRADGDCALRERRRTERLHAVELTGSERDRVVHAYRSMLGHAVDGFFARIPDPRDHPVFRLEPIGPSIPPPVHA